VHSPRALFPYPPVAPPISSRFSLIAESPHHREAGSTRVVCSRPHRALCVRGVSSANAHRPSSSRHAPLCHTHLPYLSRCTAGDENVPLSAPRRLDATRLPASARYIADLRRSPTVVASFPLRSSSSSIPGSPPVRLVPVRISQTRIGTLGVCVRGCVRARRRRRVDRTPSLSLLASSSGTTSAAAAQRSPWIPRTRIPPPLPLWGMILLPRARPGIGELVWSPGLAHPVVVRLVWCGARSTVDGRRGRYGLPATSWQRAGSA
jgi:hypothetical protein